jgi:hypothetical protein
MLPSPLQVGHVWQTKISMYIDEYRMDGYHACKSLVYKPGMPNKDNITIITIPPQSSRSHKGFEIYDTYIMNVTTKID